MKEPATNHGASRREFLRGSIRYGLLTGLATVSAVLFKSSGGKLSGQTCSNEGICSGCTIYPDCGLPQALSAKESKLRSSRREEAQTHQGKNQNLLTSAPTVKKGVS